MFNSKGEYLGSEAGTGLDAGQSGLVTIYFAPSSDAINKKTFPSTVSLSGMQLIEYGPITGGIIHSPNYGSVYKIPLG